MTCREIFTCDGGMSRQKYYYSFLPKCCSRIATGRSLGTFSGSFWSKSHAPGVKTVEEYQHILACRKERRQAQHVPTTAAGVETNITQVLRSSLSPLLTLLVCFCGTLSQNAAGDAFNSRAIGDSFTNSLLVQCHTIYPWHWAYACSTCRLQYQVCDYDIAINYIHGLRLGF